MTQTPFRMAVTGDRADTPCAFHLLFHDQPSIPSESMVSHKILKIITPWWFSLVVWLVIIDHGSTADDKTPWGAVPGEKLVYNVHWLGVPAGRASLLMKTQSSGQVEFEASAISIGAVEVFHPIHDRLRAIATPSPIGYITQDLFRDQRKGGKIRLTHDHFDWKNKILNRDRQGEDSKQLDIVLSTTTDPLTGFFSIRSMPDFGPGKTLQIPMLVGWAIEMVTLRADAIERRFGPIGWFEVFPVTLDVPNSDLFRNPSDLVIWLTADRRRLPFRIETVLRLGRAAADLVSYDDGRGGHGHIIKEVK